LCNRGAGADRGTTWALLRASSARGGLLTQGAEACARLSRKAEKKQTGGSMLK
jgi:hypothetical protein